MTYRYKRAKLRSAGNFTGEKKKNNKTLLFLGFRTKLFKARKE